MSAHSEIHSSTLFNCAVYSKHRMPHIPIKPVKKCNYCERRDINITELFKILLNNFALCSGTISKEPVCQCRRHNETGLIPQSGRSPGGGLGNPLQYSCLENPMDRGAWQTTVHRVTVGYNGSNLVHSGKVIVKFY